MKRSFYGNIDAFFERYLVWWTQNTLTSLSGGRNIRRIHASTSELKLQVFR